MHVSGLIISLRGQANPLFLRENNVTPTEKRLYVGQVKKVEVHTKSTIWHHSSQ